MLGDDYNGPNTRRPAPRHRRGRWPVRCQADAGPMLDRFWADADSQALCSLAHIQPIPQAVAEEIDGENYQGDGDAGGQDQMGGGRPAGRASA